LTQKEKEKETLQKYGKREVTYVIIQRGFLDGITGSLS
jgi:hypothetical protein